MGTLQKAVVLVLGTAFVTTLILPGRQTVPVLGAISRLSTGAISTSQGTSHGAVG